MTFVPPSPTEFEVINGSVEFGNGFTFILDEQTADTDYSSIDSITANYTIGPSFDLIAKVGPPVGPYSLNTNMWFYIWKPGAPDVNWEYIEFQIGLNENSPPDGLDLTCDWQPRPGFYAEPARIPYDPVAHQWIRFTVDNGTLYWRTSPNNQTWTVIASIPFPPSFTPDDPIGLEMDFGAWFNDEPYDGMTTTWDYLSVNGVLIFGEIPDVREEVDPSRWKSASACVEVTGEGHVQDVAVGVWFKHPNLENIEVWLRGPSPHNKRALLVDHNGGGADLGEGHEDHQLVIFEDDGETGAVADWEIEYGRTGNYVPITNLTDTYVGTDVDDYANGWWCIDVIDTQGETFPEIWQYCLYIVTDRIPLSPLGQLWPRGGGDRMIDALNTKFRDRQLLVGIGRPFQDIGQEGDCYLDERTTILYGPKGPDGWDYENFSMLGRLDNSVVFYEQARRPSNAPLGAIWLETDG